MISLLLPLFIFSSIEADILSSFNSGFHAPLKRLHITGNFGKRFHPVTKKVHIHSGIDFRASEGSLVHVAESGVVIYCGVYKGYGTLLSVLHADSVTTHYAHLNRLLVEVGERVVRGQVVALTGNTGLTTAPHLHFEVRFKGEALDPEGFFS